MDDHSDELKTVTTLEGASAVIVVAGEVDAVTSDILTNAVHGAAARGARLLVLDLSGVEFMDSSGIAALIAARATAAVTLRQPSLAVRRLLDLTGLTEVLAVEP